MDSIKKLFSSFIIISLLIPNISFSHSGNTNSNGCHNDNVNGGYHCHNKKDSASSSGGGELIAVAVIVSLAYWYYYNQEQSAFDYLINTEQQTNYKFSIEPTFYESQKLGGASLKFSYAF